MTTVGDLTLRHVGQRVTIQDREATVSGVLTDLRVETDWVELRMFAQHPDEAKRVPGRQTITLAVGPWVTTSLPLDTPVDIE